MVIKMSNVGQLYPDILVPYLKDSLKLINATLGNTRLDYKIIRENIHK